MSGFWLLSYIVLWLLFLALAFAFVSLLRNMGELADAVKQLGTPHETLTLTVNQVAPPLALETFERISRSTADFRGQSTTFALISPGCGPCRSLMGALADGDVPDEFAAVNQRVIISTASAEETQATVAEFLLPPDVTLLLDTQQSAAQGWGVRSTPTFITLDAQGRYVKHSIGFATTANQSITA